MVNKRSANQALLFQLAAAILVSFGVVFSMGFLLFIMISRNESTTTRGASPMPVAPASEVDLPPSLPPQLEDSTDQERRVDSGEGHELCVVTLVKVFDYSFDRASDICRSKKSADEAIDNP